MYAIVEVGGRQYKAKKHSFLDVDRMDIKEKKAVALKKVLFLKDGKEVKIGRPYLKGVSVECECISIFSGRKVISYWYRRRKSSKRKVGARHKYTRLLVNSIKSEEK